MKEIDFIAKYYEKGKFNRRNGWKKLGISSVSWWRKYGIAVSIAGIIIVSCSATIIIRKFKTTEQSVESVEEPSKINIDYTSIIDYEDTPLSEVVSEIEKVYGVKVVGLPDDIDSYRLTLHYEGTPKELIEVINETIGTRMKLDQE